MPMSNPNITFLFPYRWLNDDKAFLGANLVKSIQQQIGKGDSASLLKRVMAYNVTIAYQSYYPVTVDLAVKDLQRMLKPIFPNGKLIDLEVEYTQHKSKTMLPLMDFQIFI